MKKSFLPYKWELVALLWLAFFFNQADRQIFNVVLPLIRDDLNLTDADMGLIASIFTLVYGLLVPVAGFLGDKIKKKYIIITSLIFWSIATMFTGFATGLIGLIILRSLSTGGGEAFYAPSANSIISENHGVSTRATALSIHQTALYVGIIASGYMVGALAERYGWRETFYLFGGLGFILGIILIFRIKKSNIVQSTQLPAAKKPGMKQGILVFFRTPSAVLLALAFAGMQFTGVGFLTWMPTYLHETFGFSLARSGFDATFYHHVAAFVGVLGGAKIADHFSKKYVRIRLLIQMTGLLVGAPFIFLMAKSSSILMVYIAMSFFGIFRGMYDSNIFASVYDVIEEKYRATATGFMLMFAFVVGSTSPFILGVIKPALGLSNGLASLSFVYFFSATILCIAMLFTLKKEVKKIGKTG
jgi:sugar phosphate permease